MTDGLEWVHWMRAIWEARRDSVRLSVVHDAASEIAYQCEAVEFLSLWLEDLLHVGRVYDDAP